MKKIYLAIPYSGMEESSFKQATEAAAIIINEHGHNVFSPITHSHPLTKYGVKGTWEYWQKIDCQYIDWCDEVVVLIPNEGLERIKESIGVNSEIRYASSLKKPVSFVTLESGVLIDASLPAAEGLSYSEITGDLIELAKAGRFDVIAHGCNCFCTMGRGLAPKMAKEFGCDKFKHEQAGWKGDINKLGTIEFEFIRNLNLTVVNCYTQYHWSATEAPFDYDAFAMCMRKMDKIFKGTRIGLPKIGTGLAGGNWDKIKKIIQEELTSCQVTIVVFDGEPD
jgi:O-acetyl-ADP-ribose deacetylase (regulator of RNase III)/nucleoside 2-deoxyribosyltransferase